MTDRDDANGSLPESLKDLAADIGLLVRKELEAARAEMADKLKAAGIGAGMLSGSALTGLLTLGSLTAFMILIIATAVKPWLGALIVTVFWATVTGVLALVGKRKIQQATPFVPERTIEHVKEDVEWAKDGIASARK